MTLIRQQRLTAAADRPSTHVLAIGVNEYPHLEGGDPVVRAELTFGLRQLTSPQISATAFANWFLDKYANPKAPLGSVDVLLSPGPFSRPNGTRHRVRRARYKDIAATFLRWERRCGANAANIGIFYFCGHGFEYDQTILLPEDFGDPAAGDVWGNGINFKATWYGMYECRARVQCYFIDACRDTPPELLSTRTVTARALKNTTWTRFPPRDGPIYMAAPTTGSKALAKEGAVSCFTDALLKCLGGDAGRSLNGRRWVVTTASLGDALRERMSRTTLPDGSRGACDPDAGASHFTTDLHHLPGVATVMARVSCKPTEALPFAELSVQDSDGNTPPLSRAPNPDPWELEIGAGDYNIDARFAGREYQDKTEPRLRAYPPVFDAELEVDR